MSSNPQAILRVACEDDETEMRKDGFADIKAEEVPALRESRGSNHLRSVPVGIPAESSESDSETGSGEQS